MLNKLDNLNSQTRIIIAVVLALAFFVPYSYFYAPKPQENNATATASSIQTTQNLPTTKEAKPNSIQESTQISTTQEIITTINGENFEYQIDRLGKIAQVTLKEEK